MAIKENPYSFKLYIKYFIIEMSTLIVYQDIREMSSSTII